MVLEAFKSPEPEQDSDCPKVEQPRSKKWLPILVANTSFVIVGLLLLSGIWWVFGPSAAANAMYLLGGGFIACMAILAMIGKASSKCDTASARS